MPDDMDGAAGYVERFRERLLQDALAEATSHYWLRRAESFAAVGTRLCDDIAQACRDAAVVAVWDTSHPAPCCAEDDGGGL